MTDTDTDTAALSEITITIDIVSIEAAIRSIDRRSAAAGFISRADAAERGRARALVCLYNDARFHADNGRGNAILCNGTRNYPYRRGESPYAAE